MIKIYDGRNEFFQWDLDRKIAVSDPTVTEVHFCNKTSDCSLVVEVKDGLADVPNILFQTDWPINVYAYCGECYTKEHVVFKVNRRTKPDDYVYTETEVKRWEDLAKRIDDKIEQLDVSEAERATAEEGRVVAENERVAAEESRVVAEEQRNTSFGALSTAMSEATVKAEDLIEELSNYEGAINNHGERIAINEVKTENHEKRITNVERHINQDYFITDDATAYNKVIPTDVCPYAQLNSVGGMTYKTNNLIPFPYVDTTRELLGITFTVSDDGIVTLNGTTTLTSDVIDFTLAKDLYLPAGNYFLSGATGGSTYTYRMFCWIKKADGTSSYKSDGTFTLEQGDYIYRLAIRVGYEIGTVNNLVIKPMINAGSTALPYEPYFKGLRDTKVTEIVSHGKNLFDASKIKNTQIEVSEDGRAIKLPLKSSGNGFTSTEVTLGELCPSLKVGDTAIFNFTANGASTLQSIYLSPIFMWAKGKSLVITQEYLDSMVIMYGNNIVQGNNTTEQVTITDFRMNLGTVSSPYTPYREPITYPIPQSIIDAQTGKGMTGFTDTIDLENGKIITQMKTIKLADISSLDVSKYASDTLEGNGYISSNGFIRMTSYDVNDFVLNTKNAAMCNVLPNTTDWQGREAGINLQKMTDGKHYIALTLPIEWLGVDVTDSKSNIRNKAIDWLRKNDATLVYALEKPIETDFSTSEFDNFLSVEGGGTLRFANEYEKAVPSSVTYLMKEGSI